MSVIAGPSDQDHVIATIDSSIGGTTITHAPETSCSSDLSQPVALANLLLDIAA